MTLKVLLCFMLFCLANLCFADEVRPGYLELKENSPNVFSVLWKVPAKGNKTLSLQAQLPHNCTNKTQADAQLINGAYIQRWITACNGGLVEQEISITGLDTINTDVLLRLEFIDSASQSVQLTPSKSTYHVTATSSSLQIVSTYTKFGIEHILLGTDHLLFVFALLLIVHNTRRLLITITAFTLAHSITLAAATLGFVHVAQQPVEAVIALSILFLAMEIVHEKRGRSGYTARWPWLIAFIFGLLHGFGFAGALAEIGLPQQAIPIALIFFNIGVELGQLLFVLGIVFLSWLLHQINQQKLIARAETAVIYSIGGFSSFWLFERISQF
ncbi:Membrane protein [hydrothermal vent metagenome]|uniref:Membrane protein n=1 Tax=hydrothermal vent metagenome TaxID=652676 RepID=A0A3B0X8S3_9ZZZZ